MKRFQLAMIAIAVLLGFGSAFAKANLNQFHYEFQTGVGFVIINGYDANNCVLPNSTNCSYLLSTSTAMPPSLINNTSDSRYIELQSHPENPEKKYDFSK